MGRGGTADRAAHGADLVAHGHPCTDAVPVALRARQPDPQPVVRGLALVSSTALPGIRASAPQSPAVRRHRNRQFRILGALQSRPPGRLRRSLTEAPLALIEEETVRLLPGNRHAWSSRSSIIWNHSRQSAEFQKRPARGHQVVPALPGIREPAAMDQIRRILAIPRKKTDTRLVRRLVRHLKVEEMHAILNAPTASDLGWRP